MIRIQIIMNLTRKGFCYIRFCFMSMKIFFFLGERVVCV